MLRPLSGSRWRDCGVLALLLLCACTSRQPTGSGSQPQSGAQPESPKVPVGATNGTGTSGGPRVSRTSSPAAPPAAATGLPTASAVPSAAPTQGTAILSASVAPAHARPGDTVVWDVRTTPDVTTVEARVTMATIPLQRESPGHFTLSFKLPDSVPGLFHGNYSVDIVGKTSAGTTVHRTIPLSLK
jgi:hypothetical protein